MDNDGPRNIHAFTVLPDTPDKLNALNELAYNMWFSWNKEARNLFDKLDPDSWRESAQNPVRALCIVPEEKLDRAARDFQYLAELDAVHERFSEYMSATTWFARQYGDREKPTIAYFSCEFGLHECLPIYSGGLGVLSGDHLKSASDIGIPMVAVGLLYRQGYFHQYLNADGMQQESYPENDWYNMPVHQECNEDGSPLTVSIELGGGTLNFHVWRVDVGRVRLYLLDTNIPENKPQDRAITVRLYDPDRDVRLRQEMLLGIGGVRALRQLGYEPKVYHANEGHSAFLTLERVRLLMAEKGLSFAEARQVVWSSTVFTTHTPVPAGNERFAADLMKPYFQKYIEQLGLSWKDFLALGRVNPADDVEEFCMTVLAIRMAAFVNGVSKLHGQISRNMWRGLFPGIPGDEVPIGHVTNGVHTRTWLNRQLRNLFLRYVGPSSINGMADFTMWTNIDNIPDSELWHIHLHNKRRMVDFIRETLQRQLLTRGSSAGEITRLSEVLNPEALTIGFARRFATYKRGYMLFRQPERLARILLNPERPVQIVLAGKAHPADQGGKEIIRRIVELANRPDLRGHIIFLEDYDMNSARHLVQSVDVWLNTPRRPMEASGTSGMKAAVNGALNLSILDGWWDEAYTPEVGWAIGHGESYDDHDLQDEIEGDLLYHILEREVVPCYYTRNADGLPESWVKMMRSSIKNLGEGFNSHRMLVDYAVKYYRKGEDLHDVLAAEDFQPARDLTAWLAKLTERWPGITIVKTESPTADLVPKGHELEVRAWVKLNGIDPDQVCVELYHGSLATSDRIDDPERARMEVEGEDGDQTVYHAIIPCKRGGRHGYTVRLLPGHPNLAETILPNLIKWA